MQQTEAKCLYNCSSSSSSISNSSSSMWLVYIPIGALRWVSRPSMKWRQEEGVDVPDRGAVDVDYVAPRLY